MISFTDNQRLDLAILVENMILSKGQNKTAKLLKVYPATLISIMDAKETPRYDHIVHRLRTAFPEINQWKIDWNGQTYKLSDLAWPKKLRVNRHNNLEAVGLPQPRHRVAAAKINKTHSHSRTDKTLAQALKLWPEASICLDKQGTIIINTNIRID